MGISLTILAFVFTIVFGAIGYTEKFKNNGKFSMGNVVLMTFFLLLMVTGITDIICKDKGGKANQKEIIEKLDSAEKKIDKIDTALGNLSNKRS